MRARRSLRPLPLLLLLALALGGCTGAPPPADSYYRLTVAPAQGPATDQATGPLLPGTVEVNRFSADGMIGERPLLYSYAGHPDQLLRYTYHLWTEPPPALLQDQLVNTLRAAHVADRVVTGEMNVAPNFVIEGRLHRFEQIAGPAPKVVVEADIGVVQLHGSDLLMLNTYHVEQPIASDGPADAVAGFQRAAGTLFGRFLDDLAHLSIKPQTR